MFKDTAPTRKATAQNAARLALRLASNRRFRDSVVAAIRHSGETRPREQRWLATIRSLAVLAADHALQRQLRAGRVEIGRADLLARARKRRRLLRKFAILAALGSILAMPTLGKRLSRLASKKTADPHPRASLEDDTPRASRVQSLEELTRDELYARAQAAEIPGRSEMTKAELVAALRARH
jgi:hypothetical protein